VRQLIRDEGPTSSMNRKGKKFGVENSRCPGKEVKKKAPALSLYSKELLGKQIEGRRGKCVFCPQKKRKNVPPRQTCWIGGKVEVLRQGFPEHSHAKKSLFLPGKKFMVKKTPPGSFPSIQGGNCQKRGPALLGLSFLKALSKGMFCKRSTGEERKRVPVHR